MNFFRGFSLKITCTLLVFALGFANSVLLAGQLGREQYGVLAVWINIVMLGSLFLGDWLNKGNIYIVGRERAREAAINHTLLYGLTLGALLLLSAPFSLKIANLLLPGITLVQWVLGVGVIALTVLQNAGLSILLGEDRLKLHALLPMIFIVVYLGGNLVLFQLGDFRLEGVMGIWIGAVGATALAALVPFLYNSGFRFKWGGRYWLEQIFRVGSRGEVCAVLIFLMLKSDLFLILHFLGEEEVGVYRVATNFTDMVQRVPNVASLVLLAKIVRGQDSTRLSLNIAQGVFAFALLSAVGLVLGGRPLLSLFFPLYPDAYAPLVWLLPGMLFLGCGAVFNAKLMGEGYPSITLWAPGVALAANVALNLLLIPKLGLRGAALSTSLAYALWGVLTASYYLRLNRLGWRAVFALPSFGREEPSAAKQPPSV